MVLGNVCLKGRLRLVVTVAFCSMDMVACTLNEVRTEYQHIRPLTGTYPCKNKEFLLFPHHLPPV